MNTVIYFVPYAFNYLDRVHLTEMYKECQINILILLGSIYFHFGGIIFML